MLTNKENFLETLKKNGNPDRLVNGYEAGAFLPGDPMSAHTRIGFHRGMEPKKDIFGTVFIWPEDGISVMPHVTDKTKVIDDITEWKEQLTIPDMTQYAGTDEQWAPFLERVASVPRDKYMLMPFMPTGIFERLHYLMGFEDLFCNMYEEPDDLMELIEAIGDYRLKEYQLMVEHVHPDMILCHDDWGTKTSLFMQPEM